MTRAWRVAQVDQERREAEEERVRVEDQERRHREALEKRTVGALALKVEQLEKELAALQGR
jgi:hypothetical protein